MDNSVDFSGNNIFYDFLNLDISGIMTLDPSFIDLYFIPGISGYDATANLDVSLNKFNNLFFVNVKLQDLSDNSYNDMKFAMDPSGWNAGSAVPFSSATVDKIGSISPNVINSKQQIKYDLVRFFLSQITGSTNLNNLFRNKTDLINSVSSIDASFQDKIKNIISTAGGTFQSPLDNSTMNPVGIMMNSILGEDDDGVDNFNDLRKNTLISYLNTKTNEIYENSKGNKYYFYGNNTVNGLGWYYPLYIDPSHVDLSGVAYQNIMFNNNGMVFYIPDLSSNKAVNPKPTFDGTYTDYSVVDNSFIPIPFYDGDKLSVKLSYYPKNNTVAGHNIGQRSYKVILNLKEGGGGTVVTFTFSPVGTISQPVYDIVGSSSNDIYIRSGSMQNSYFLKRWDGTTWSTISSNYNTGVMKVVKFNSDIYVASYYNGDGYISKYDGTTWTVLAGGIPSNSIDDIAVIGSDIYVVGPFTSIGGVSASYIAKWNGTTWSALGSAADGGIFCMTVNGTDLYVGGSFTNIGGVTATQIAKWNGTTWSALGSGVNTSVRSISYYNSKLYVGTYLGSIHMWNGTTWSVLGTGVSGGLINSITLNGSDIYIGGSFTTLADSTPANRIAKWNGTTWSAIGNGVNQDVYDVNVINQTLYVGGQFISANGDTTIRNIVQITI